MTEPGLVLPESLVPTPQVAVVCAAYFLGVLVVQYLADRPAKEWLLGRVRHLRVKAQLEKWKLASENGSGKRPGLGLFDDLEDTITRRQRLWMTRWMISGAAVQAGWRQIHAIEDDHLFEIPKPVAYEQLHSMLTEIEELDDPEAEDYETRMVEMLESDEDEDPRQLLHDVSVWRHRRNDRNHEELAALLNKAVWLILIGLGLVIALGHYFGRESLFLAGATGGFVGRLTRVLWRRPTSHDYGAAWSTLLLAPVGGAVAGWTGVLLVNALAGEPFHVFSAEGIGKIWDHPLQPLALVLALVFGFSERFFNRILTRAENQLTRRFGKGERDGDRGRRSPKPVWRKDRPRERSPGKKPSSRKRAGKRSAGRRT